MQYTRSTAGSAISALRVNAPNPPVEPVSSTVLKSDNGLVFGIWAGKPVEYLEAISSISFFLISSVDLLVRTPEMLATRNVASAEIVG